MEQTQEQPKKKDNRKWIVIILLLLCVIIISWVLTRNSDEEQITTSNDATQDSESDFQEEITLSKPRGQLIDGQTQGAGSWAIDDGEQYVYYGVTDEEKQAVMVFDFEAGEKVERWSVGVDGNEHLEVVGLNESSVLFTFLTKDNPTCDDIWSTDLVYYGVSQGTDNYSGAAGLLYENDPDFIENMRLRCSEQ